MSETFVPDTLKSPAVYKGPDTYERATNTNVWFFSRNDNELLHNMVVEQPVGGTAELKSLSGRPATEEQLRAYLEIHERMASLAVVESLENTYYDY